MNGAPDALGGGRHFDVGHAKFGERVDNRIDDDAECRGRPAFAGRADPERVGRGRNFAELGREKRQPVGARQRVIQQRAGQQLTGVAIVDAILAQCLAEPVGNAAMDLAMHDQRIDRAPDIIDGVVAHDFDDAGVGVDLDLADVAAIGETCEVDCLVAFGTERAAQLLGQIVAA